jgi:8-oxo-dGTP diphosphatase
MTVAPMHPVDVLLILTNADHVLLALRDGTGYADGHWNLPSGKLEQGEDALSAVIREAREEIGVQLGSDAPRMVATVHHRCAARLARVGLVFAVAYDAYAYTAACVRAFRDGEPFRLSGSGQGSEPEQP